MKHDGWATAPCLNMMAGLDLANAGSIKLHLGVCTRWTQDLVGFAKTALAQRNAPFSKKAPTAHALQVSRVFSGGLGESYCFDL